MRTRSRPVPTKTQVRDHTNTYSCLILMSLIESGYINKDGGRERCCLITANMFDMHPLRERRRVRVLLCVFTGCCVLSVLYSTVCVCAALGVVSPRSNPPLLLLTHLCSPRPSSCFLPRRHSVRLHVIMNAEDPPLLRGGGSVSHRNIQFFVFGFIKCFIYLYYSK